FNYVSCRELEDMETLNVKFNLKAENHVDPTLLLTDSVWNFLADPNRKFKEEYILIYTVKQPKNLLNEAKKIAKEKGMKIVQLRNRQFDREINYVSNPSVGAFLSLFRDASYILTNSFHGTAFSIIYKKNFLVEFEAEDGSVNTRSKSLLDLLNLTQQL